MSSQPYCYSPLKANEIRLLDLIPHPHSNEDPRFRLSHEPLDSNLMFDAVSYTWGSTTRENSIYHTTHGHTLKVTENCKLALRNLAAAKYTTIWIDAICINQDDVQERSQQVKLMNKIFRQARATIAYLGEPDMDLPLMSSWTNESELHNASKLLQKPWNSRTWVIQEALLSKNLIFRFGSEQFSFPTMAGLDRAIRKHLGGKVDGVVALKDAYSERQDVLEEQKRASFQALYVWRTTTKELDLISPEHLLNPGHLFDVLCATSHYGCQDPRDRVFALLALFEKGFPGDIQPDYSLSPEDLYTNVSRFLICYGVERVLSAANGSGSALPSWAVDWSSPPPGNAKRSEGWFYASHSCRAGWLLMEYKSRKLAVQPVGLRGLEVRGLKIAKITSCAEALSLDEPSLNDWKADMDMLLPGRASGERLLWKSEDGAHHVIPKDTKDGDCICVLRGFSLPYVLRPCEQDWKLVGECYAEGYMEGEALQSEDTAAKLEAFVLY